MSNVRFRCQHCGQMFEGAAEDAWAEAECPSCGKAFKLEPIGVALAVRPSGLQCYFWMLKNYIKFSGRTQRREFWWAVLFNIIALVGLFVVDMLAFDVEDDDWCPWFFLVYLLASVVPMVALQFRRLHDTGKNGWWWLLFPLPVVDVAYLVWLIDDGDKGRNRFGPDPKGR